MPDQVTTTPDDDTEENGLPSVKKLSMSWLGNRRAPTQEEMQERGGHYLGRIKGIATGVRYVPFTDPKTGETRIDEVILGKFYAKKPDMVAKDGTVTPGSEVQSGNLFLPDGFHQTVLDQVAPFPVKDNGDVGDKRRAVGAEFMFAYDFYTITRGDSGGYAYELRPIIETKRGKSSPLDRINARIAAAEQVKQITHDPAPPAADAEGATPPAPHKNKKAA